MSWGAVGWAFVKIVAAAAVSYGISRLTQPDQPDVEGPRLDDLSTQSSAYGEPITMLHGAARLGGNIIWSTGLKEHESEESVGGKGGGGGTRTTYTYTCTFAVGIGEGPIGGIGRIWGDGKLLSDPSSIVTNIQNADLVGVRQLGSGSDEDMVDLDNESYKNNLYVMKGTSTQEPHSIIEAEEGAGNVPGYRGVAYVIFEELQLGDFGNRIPFLEFEVFNNTTTSEINVSVDSAAELFVISTANDFYVIASRSENWMKVYDGTGNLIRTEEDLDIEYLALPPEGMSSFGGDNTILYALSSGTFREENAVTGEIYYEEKDFWGTYDSSYSGPITGGTTESSGLTANIPEAATIGYLQDVVTSEYQEPGYAGAQVALSTSEYGGYVWAVWADVLDEGQNHFALFDYDEDNGRPSYKISNTTVSAPKNGDNDAFIDIDENGNVFVSWSSDRSTLKKYTNWDSLFDDNYTESVTLSSGIWIGRYPETSIFLSKDGTVVNFHDGMTTEIKSATTMDEDNLGKSVTKIVEGVFEKAGLSSNDYFVDSSLGEVTGFPIKNTSSAAEALEPLMKLFHFIIVETEGQIHCLSEATQVERKITEDKLVVDESSEEYSPVLTTTYPERNNLPTVLVIEYLDYDADYQKSAQFSQMYSTDYINTETVTMPVVATATDMLRASEELLAEAWEQRIQYKFSMTIENIDILPGSIIEVAGHKIMTNNTKLKSPGIIEVEGLSIEPKPQ